MPPSLSESNAERTIQGSQLYRKTIPAIIAAILPLRFVITYISNFNAGLYVVLVPNFPRSISIPKLLAHPDVYVQYDRKWIKEMNM